MDNESAKKASSYKKGDLLRISSRNGASNWFVKQIDDKSNSLTLSGEHSNRPKKLILDKIDFKNQFVSKIEKAEMEVREGEILRTSSRMYEHNIESNTDLKVKKIVPGFLVLKDGKKSILMIKASLNGAPLKYGYTKSLHTTSTKRYDTTVSVLKPYQTNKNNIFKINALSKSSSIIVTEDKEKAIKYSHRETNRGSSISADNYSGLSIEAGNILNRISETTAVFSKQDYFKEAISNNKDYTQSKLNTDIADALENGYLIKKDYSLKKPLIIYHLSNEKMKSKNINLRLDFELEQNSSLKLIDFFSDDSEKNFMNIFYNFNLDKDAILKNYKIDKSLNKNLKYSFNNINQKQNSISETFIFSAGSDYFKNEINCNLKGEYSSAFINGIFSLDDNKQHEIRTTINHLVENTKSYQLIKSVLGKNTKSAYQGRIYVDSKAQKTDGYQLSKAILLDETSEFNAKPELEIYADDVKCSHGSASGSLDDNSIFYLMSRGLNYKQAKGLLINGFLLDVIEKITDAEIKDLLKKMIGLKK